MSGDQNSVDDRLKNRNEALDKIESELGLGVSSADPPECTSDIQKYFDMSRDQLEKLQAEDCEYAAFQISQYTLFLQRKVNRLQAIKKWSENELRQIVAKEFDSYSGPWEMREPKVINENSAAKKLKDISLFAEQQITRMWDIPRHLEALAKRIDGIKFSRMREYKNGENQ